MVYRPPFVVTSAVLNLCTEISRILGVLENNPVARQPVILRRQNRIRSIQASLAIEGNSMSLDQVTALLDHKKVIGPKKDVLEVTNAIAVFDAVSLYKPGSATSFKSAHSKLMSGLLADAGEFRSGGIGILKGKKVAHVAPPAERVPTLMQQVFDFIDKDSETHLLIKACVVHYKIEFIHPFSDGNGRMGRLWQTVLLTKLNPVFEFVPVESIIKERQKEYCDVLEKCDKAGTSTLFIEFALATILKALQDLSEQIVPVRTLGADRLQQAREHFGSQKFSRKDYMRLFKSIATATASRDLLAGVEKNILSKQGDKASTRYFFL